MSAATLCACARSFAARQKSDLAGRRRLDRVEPLLDPVRQLRDDGMCRVEHALRAAEAALQLHDGRVRQLRLEVAQVLRRDRAEAPQRLVVVAGRGEVAVLGRQQPQQQAVREVRFLHVVDEQVAVARGDARAHVRVLAQQSQRADDEVAGVERSLLGEHPVVRAVDLGELALACGAGALGVVPCVVLHERLGPCRVVLGADQLVLQPVDPPHEADEQRCRVAAEVVAADRQLVDPLQQHREPVGAPYGDGERVDPAVERLLAQQPRAERMDRRHRQLLVGPRDRVLDLAAQRVGGALGQREREHRLRRLALLDEPGEAGSERARLATAGTADDQQRAAGMRSGRALRRGESVERGHPARIWGRWNPVIRRLTRIGSAPAVRQSPGCGTCCARTPRRTSAPSSWDAARAAIARS